MKIAIEAQRIMRKKKHGMDIAILEIIQQLQLIDSENEYYIFVKKGDDPCIHSTKNFHIVELDCPSYPLWEQWALPRAAKKVGADVLHSTSNTAPLFCTTKLLLTLHDLFFLDPEEGTNSSFYQKFGRFYRRLIVPAVLPKCEQVITVSNDSFNQIKTRGLMDVSKLSVIYNGYSSSYKVIEHTSSVTHKYTQSEKYYLFFGNTDPRKNTHRVIEAFCRYLQDSRSKKYPLLITVITKRYVDDILLALGMPELSNYFICMGYVPKDDLPYLYNGAMAYLNPSLKEGFGIPILESMACGTPVVTGNLSAMPEVAGDGAVVVDPKDTQAITEAIIKIETNDEWRKEIIAYGLERVKKFSWETAARQLLEIYKGYQQPD